MLKLWPFSGGLRLDSRKQDVVAVPLTTAQMPKELIYPLLLRDGRPAKPLVRRGERVSMGQPIIAAEDWAHPSSHAAACGRVRGIEQRVLPHPSGLSSDCIVVDVDGEGASLAFVGVADYTAMAASELRACIHAAGIVGLGGAGFPTAVKLEPGGREIDTLILNGVECEPYISSDDSLMRHFPADVLGGAKILLRILGAGRCLLAIKEDMPEALAALEQARQDCPELVIVPVPAIYPAGGEKQLIYVLTGREVPAGGLPADVGVICQNVATAAAVHKAVVFGEPLLSRIVTVTGQGVRQPRNLLVRIGTPVAELVAQCGGYTRCAERLIMGGPMMGFALASDEVPILKNTTSILVAGPDEAVEKHASACIRCGACVEACPAGLLPQQLYWHARAEQWGKLADYHLSACIECGCCDLVCPSHIPLVQYFRAAKSQLAAQAAARLQAEQARLRYEARQARKAREKLDKAEADRRKKALLEKIRRG